MISETMVEPLSLHVLLRHNETLPFFFLYQFAKTKQINTKSLWKLNLLRRNLL